MRDLRQILATLAQRRDAQPHDVESVEQVVAERSVGHGLLEILRGGRDDAHVDRPRAIGAEPANGVILEHTEEADLECRGHVANLVEEERAAVRLLEHAAAGPVGTREGALVVAEELRLEERARDGAAVDRDERAGAPRRAAMDREGDELLAGARLARDEHRGVGGRDLPDELADLVGLARAAEETPRRHLGAEASARRRAFSSSSARCSRIRATQRTTSPVRNGLAT